MEVCTMENILVSACLLGVQCRYDGGGNMNQHLEQAVKEGKVNLIPVCPEIIGGLRTPRTPCERKNDKIMAKDGADCTEAFEKGAREVLRLAKLYGCHYAILKERSPSCGYGKIYDGTFTGTLVEGNGRTAELLAENGIEIIGESALKRFVERSSEA